MSRGRKLRVDIIRRDFWIHFSSMSEFLIRLDDLKIDLEKFKIGGEFNVFALKSFLMRKLALIQGKFLNLCRHYWINFQTF